MRLILLTFLFLIQCLITIGQNYKPTILILDPFKTKYDSLIVPEIMKFKGQAEINSQEENEFIESLKGQPKNIIKMKTAEREFASKMNFGSYFTLMTHAMVSYMVYGQTEKCVVIPSHTQSGGQINEFKKIAEKFDVQWIINPLSLKTFVKDGDKYTAVRIQVFDAKKNKVVLDRVYNGGSTNPGFELSCETDSVECTISNVLGPALKDIMPIVYKN